MHNTTYYIVRSIIRFIVKVAIVAFAFIGIHALASNFIAAFVGSLALWLVYAVIVDYQNNKAVAAQG